MITLDTNVLVRVLVGDDPVQTPIAERVFVDGCGGGGVYVPLVVLAELGWVLRAGYKLERAVIHERLVRLARTRGVHLESSTTALDALDAYGQGSADLSDYLILRASMASGAAKVVTFDQRLGREDGVDLPRPDR